MRIATVFVASLISLAIPSGILAKDQTVNRPADIKNQEFVEQLKTGASPLIHGNQVTFVYRGEAKTVVLVGEMTGWGRSIALRKLGGKNIRYLTLTFPANARLEYKYMVNGQWQLDSLNPQRQDNGIGGLNNFFTMPDYRPSLWTQSQPDIRRGKIEDIGAMFADPKNQRKVKVYLPPGYDDDARERYPTVYFSDGMEYLERARADVITDNLIAAKTIRPVILVFIAPLDRVKEYWMNKSYVDFLAQEVVPKIDARYRTMRQNSARAVTGASLGGLIAAYAAATRADIFGKVLGQSSSFMLNSGRMIDMVLKSAKLGVEWYLEVGRYEPLLQSNRRMRKVLESKGYRLGYAEWNAGHNWTHWSDGLADGLKYLFPT
jgi:enterochelin esterase family protein